MPVAKSPARHKPIGLSARFCRAHYPATPPNSRRPKNGANARWQVLFSVWRQPARQDAGRHCPKKLSNLPIPPTSLKQGWGGRDRTYECRDQNPVPYHLATPQEMPIIKQTLIPYTNRGARPHKPARLFWPLLRRKNRQSSPRADGAPGRGR